MRFEILRMDARLSRVELAAFRRRFVADLARAHLSRSALPERAPKPFLVVTPLGMEHWELLARRLAEERIHVRECRRLPGWPEVSTPLYVRALDGERLFKAWVFEALWRMRYHSGHAEVWFLAGLRDYRRLLKIKRALREEIAESLRTKIVTPGAIFHAHLHSIHAPEPADWRADLGWISACTQQPPNTEPTSLRPRAAAPA
ncbi:MAG: hypothetical protein HY291_08820 [Planctomycetes bacterium]|nr:hypothetical protein [Planctomycetota bacterium]